jgi:hypothetical protein
MRLPRRITSDMPAAHSSPANTALSLELRHFEMWSRFGSSLSQKNYEDYLRANSLSAILPLLKFQPVPVDFRSEDSA